MKIKKDKYLQKRGGSVKILDIFCQNCSKKLFVYQKDGTGQLKRCYFNRITGDAKLENNEFFCPQCKEKIGFGIFHIDKRPAIKLLRGKIKRKKYMTTKKFQRAIEDFVCDNCRLQVEGNGYTNHCPRCLWSKHVDVNPGDRQAICQGLMEPIGIEIKRGEYIILHRCVKCGFEKRNKVAKNDNFDTILQLVSRARI